MDLTLHLSEGSIAFLACVIALMVGLHYLTVREERRLHDLNRRTADATD